MCVPEMGTGKEEGGEGAGSGGGGWGGDARRPVHGEGTAGHSGHGGSTVGTRGHSGTSEHGERRAQPPVEARRRYDRGSAGSRRGHSGGTAGALRGYDVKLQFVARVRPVCTWTPGDGDEGDAAGRGGRGAQGRGTETGM